MNKKYKNFIEHSFHKQKGYAILYAVIIVSILTLITIGLSNSTYKQLILSSLASDSQLAFYQADTASECALYADTVLGINSFSNIGYSCGGAVTAAVSASELTLTSTNHASGTTPCFDIDILKSGSTPIITTVTATGYNICNTSNDRAVQRQIQVSY